MASRSWTTRQKSFSKFGTRMYLILLALISLLPNKCISQEAPMTGATKFDYSKSYKTDVCDRQKQISNGEIELREALEGLNLSVYVTTSPFFNLTEQGTLPRNKNELGLTPQILDDLAQRAGFNWRNRFSVGTQINEEQDGNKTYSDLIEWVVNVYDIGADPWGRSSARKAKGISFVEHFYDNSIILVTKSRNNSGSRLWSFLKPFDKWVWIMIGMSIFATGFLYTFLEWLDNDADERELENKPLATTFLTAMTFTGHFEFQV